MESASTRLYVVPRSGSGWQLQETVTGPALSATGTKESAVSRATVMLEGGRGGEVVVLAPDGSVRRRFAVVPATRPWWYVRAGMWRWLLPALAALQLVLRLADDRSGPLQVVLVLGLVVLLVLTLVGARRSQALDRSRMPPDQGEQH